MKTLNRTLSLTLVFALVFSLMSFAFAADTTAPTTKTTGYTDAASITYKEAVAVTSAIGVFQGNDSNAFAPKDNLTREQAAKIITYMLLGKNNADKLTAGVAPYTDVPATRWSAGSVAYCKQMGIVAGYGDGNFGATDTVTAYQFGKMLLVALGYDPEIENFVGGNWAVNVAKRGFENDLFKYNEKFNGNAAATREEAALYTCNTLLASPVYYQSKGTTITSGGSTIHVGATAPEHYTMTVNGTTRNKLYIDMYFPNLYFAGATDDLGRSSRAWTYYNKPIGVYPVLSATITYTAKTSESTVAKALKGYTFNNAATIPSFANGHESTVPATAAGIAALTADGKTVEIYTYDGVIIKVVSYNSVLAKVTLVNTSKETVTYSVPANAYTGAVMLNSAVGYGNVKVGDYVIVVPCDAGSTTITSTSSVYSVAPATPVVGKANAKSDADKTITLGGKTYTASANIATSNTVADFVVSFSEDATLLLDTNGYIVAANSAKSVTADRAIGVQRFSQSLVNSEIVTSVVGVTSDGKTVTLPLESGSVDTGAGIYTYAPSTRESGKYVVAKITGAASYNTATKVFTKTAVTMDTNTKLAMDGTTPYTFASDMKFVYVDTANKTSKVLTGAQKITGATITYAVGKVNDENRIIAAFTTTAPTNVATLSDQLVYVNGETAGSLHNETGYHTTYKAYINGKAVENFYVANNTDLGYFGSGFYYIDKNAVSGEYNVAGGNEFTGTGTGTLAAANGLVTGLTKDASVVTVTGEVAGTLGATTQLTLNPTSTVFYNEGTDQLENVLTFAGLMAEASQGGGKFTLSVHVLYNPETGVASHVYFSKYDGANYLAAMFKGMAVDVDNSVITAKAANTYGDLASLCFAGQTPRIAATDVGYASATAIVSGNAATNLTAGSTYYFYVMPEKGTTATTYTVNVLSNAATLTGVRDTTDPTTIVFTVNGDKTITAKDGAANVTNLAAKNIAKGKIAFTTATGATAAPAFAGANVADGDTVVVTAADGTTATYTFKNALSNDATLTNVTATGLTGTASPYAVSVVKATDLTITVVPNEAHATITTVTGTANVTATKLSGTTFKINGAAAHAAEAVTFVVTAQDGTTASYTVNVTTTD